MVKLIIGLIVLGAIVFFLLSKGGEIDMSGEKHGAAPQGALPAMTT